MAGDTFDLREILLEAQAEVAAAVDEIFLELGLPAMMDQAKIQWATLSPEDKERFKLERPAEYQALMNALK